MLPFLLPFLEKRRLRRNLGSICSRGWGIREISDKDVCATGSQQSKTYPLEGHDRVLPGLLNAVGVRLDGGVTPRVVLPLFVIERKERKIIRNSLEGNDGS